MRVSSLDAQHRRSRPSLLLTASYLRLQSAPSLCLPHLHLDHTAAPRASRCLSGPRASLHPTTLTRPCSLPLRPLLNPCLCTGMPNALVTLCKTHTHTHTHTHCPHTNSVYKLKHGQVAKCVRLQHVFNCVCHDGCHDGCPQLSPCRQSHHQQGEPPATATAHCCVTSYLPQEHPVIACVDRQPSLGCAGSLPAQSDPGLRH